MKNPDPFVASLSITGGNIGDRGNGTPPDVIFPDGRLLSNILADLLTQLSPKGEYATIDLGITIRKGLRVTPREVPA